MVTVQLEKASVDVATSKSLSKEPDQRDTGSNGLFNFVYSDYQKRHEGMSNWLWIRVYLHHVLSKVVEYERPYHHSLQKFCRTPMLDAVMQRLTLVGSTASFIIIVPFMFLVGGEVSRFATHFSLVLAISVLFTNFFKDLLCLSRPAFPIERIDLVLKHSQEFGFPSCHTFLAVALGRLTMFYFFGPGLLEFEQLTLAKAMLYLFFLSIVISRIYCGMHSLLDVLGGAILGWLTSGFYIEAMPYVEASITNTHQISLLAILVIASCFILGFALPDPAWHGCPCFKDSWRVIGVIIAAPVSRANLYAFPLSKVHSVVLPFPDSLANMFIRILICGATLGSFDLVFYPIFKKTVFFYASPELSEQDQNYRLDRTSANVYCEVFKFFTIIFLASNLIPRIATALSI